jgi:O-antigen/teichoic acid export membrane protein
MEILLIGFGVAVVIATWLGIQPLLRWTAGPEFMAAAPLAIVQMFAVAMTLSGSAVRTALLAMGRQPAILKIVLGATAVFHITALTAIPLTGAMGANIAHVAMSAVWLTALMLVYHKALKEPPNPAAKPAPLDDAID